MTAIHATGTSESHHRAERATITARISLVSRDRARSIEEATRLHNRIVARAQQLRDSGDATWHSADPISTWTRKSYEEGAKSKVIVEHVTSSRVRIKLANLELVSPLVTELAEAGAQTDVNWSLTEAFERQCEQTARKEAVGAARRIADDYAEALGERITRVVSISDAPTSFGGPQARFAVAAMDSAAAEVTVAEITVSATVQGEFASE
jgi:uncharacterized protein YggE